MGERERERGNRRKEEEDISSTAEEKQKEGARAVSGEDKSLEECGVRRERESEGREKKGGRSKYPRAL